MLPLLEELIAKARRALAPAPVRVAARLHLVRVESALTAEDDRARVRISLEMALAEVEELPVGGTQMRGGSDRQQLRELARLIVAAVEPALLGSLPAAATRFGGHAMLIDGVGRTMLDHGHIQAAAEYTLEANDEEFSQHFLLALLPRLAKVAEGQELALRLIRRAAALSRLRHTLGFTSILQWHWKRLPAAEAHALVRELVDRAVSQPDQPTQASYGMDASAGVEPLLFTSGREHTLFQVFHVLRRLDPTLAALLVATHGQLAAAVKRYPDGLDSVHEQAEPSAGKAGRGAIFCGNPRDLPFAQALHAAETAAAFARALDHVLERFAEDTDPEQPNVASKEFWPSLGSLRQWVRQAILRLGPEATPELLKLLSRMPDADLRLLARIELAGALAGLPPLRSVMRRMRRRPDPGEAPPRFIPKVPEGGPALPPGCRCPACAWEARPGHRWSCRCGHLWNTFDTHGKCPSCQYQWTVTQCSRCGKVSPHEDWYGPA